MSITLWPAIPSSFIHVVTGLNMYNQKGIVKILATPYLWIHTMSCKLINTEPYKGNYYENSRTN